MPFLDISEEDLDALFNPSPSDMARRRLTTRLYLSRSFANGNRFSRDFGQPSRFVHRVFDPQDDSPHDSRSSTTEEVLITGITGTRTQLKALVTRDRGNVVELTIQAVPARGDVKDVLHLRRDDVTRFLDFAAQLRIVDPASNAGTLRIDDATFAAVMSSPEAARMLYGEHSDELRRIIAADAAAEDVIAVAHRRQVLDEFEQLMTDGAVFAERKGDKGPESVWQSFFEVNPWILGIGLSDQLFTAWDETKLERSVRGFDVSGPGKRVDALLQTAGAIRSLVFAEIKHHETPLLGSEYRTGNWAPSAQLTGGVAQIQGTVHAAVEHLGSRLQSLSDEGYTLPTEVTYLVRPRSYLIAGRLSEFKNKQGAHHQAKVLSFELYRRNTQEPEILTFDEVLARARWLVAASEGRTKQPATDDPSPAPREP